MIQLFGRSRTLFLPGPTAFLCVLTGSATTTNTIVWAQAEINRIVFEDRRHDRFAIYKLLKDGVEVPIRDEQKFDRYFIKYVLPPIAKVSGGKTDHDLPAVRAKIKRYLRAGNGPPHDRLNRIVRDFMRLVIRTIRDPDCRVNALLVLGDLNEFEGRLGRPKPLPEGLLDLVAVLKANKVPDYMRATALVGVRRHVAPINIASYPLNPEVEDELTRLMLDILNQKQVPPSRTPGGHAYIRRVAANILGAIGNVGKNGEIVEAIINAINEEDAKPLFRMGLCRAIGMFKYDVNSKVDYKEIAIAVCSALDDAAQLEIDRAELLTQQRLEWVDPDRRLLAYFFKQAFSAFKGTAPSIGRIGLVSAATGLPFAADLKTVREHMSETLRQLDQVNAFVEGKEIEDKLAAIRESLQSTSADDGSLSELEGTSTFASGSMQDSAVPAK
jgi:hypothetical protein